jgi:hypothetical protein
MPPYSESFSPLLQCGAWFCRVCQLRLVVSADITGAIPRDPHHPQFVSQSSEIFTVLLHCNKLRSKRRRLHRSLFLAQEVNQTAVDPHKDTSSGSPSYRVRGMISIHLGSNDKALACGLWHVGWQSPPQHPGAQTHWMPSPMLQTGLHQSLGRWGHRRPYVVILRTAALTY